MATELEVIPQRIETPRVNIRAPSLNALGQAAASFGHLAQNIAQGINLELQTRRGEKDVIEGKAPKTLLPGFGQAQRAYNKAVVDTEGRELARTARHMMQDAFTKAADPEKFGGDSASTFNEQLQGIAQGIYSNARPENQAYVLSQINNTADHFAARMVVADQKWRNAEMAARFNSEFTEIAEQKQDAIMRKDNEDIKFFTDLQDKLKEDYSLLSSSVRQQLPDINKKIERADKQNAILADYVEASAEDNDGEFLLNYLEEKPGNQTHAEWMETGKHLISIKKMQDSLENQARADEGAVIHRMIENNQITTHKEIDDNPILSVPQKMQQHSFMDRLQVSQNRDAQALRNLQRDALMGYHVDAGAANKAFDNNVKVVESGQGGVPLTLLEQTETIDGTPGVSQATNLPNVPMPNSVPALDNNISNYLLTDNPVQQLQGVQAYRSLSSKNPNLINISGKSLLIATTAEGLLTGDPATDMATVERVSKDILHATDADIGQRRTAYDGKMSEEVKGFFKSNFGTKFDPADNSAAFGTYEKLFRGFFVAGGNKEGAMKAANQEMSNWGTSKYGGNNSVLQMPPEKLPIADYNNALRNQYAISVQLLINQNEKDRAAGLPVDEIQWQREGFKIDLKQVEASENWKVNRVQMPYTFMTQPEVLINGHKTKLFLASGTDLRSGKPGQFTYTIQYTDPFGNVQNLTDPKNPDGVAKFIPMDIRDYAPGIFEKDTAEKQREEWKSIQLQQLRNLRSQEKFGAPDLGLVEEIIKLQKGEFEVPESFKEKLLGEQKDDK